MQSPAAAPVSDLVDVTGLDLAHLASADDETLLSAVRGLRAALGPAPVLTEAGTQDPGGVAADLEC
ncbi:hypothetical protein [Umezawaea beigongshangensis]|uniref:hypothetical protein n=1 Tax=Umezawaea beigongshangensis TaxID=2780383 RepID=UPI0018F1442E|nr:hypothetical protein [Umezawaea beigongshangensis]